MSSNITATSQRGDNKAERDELEEEFLNNCNLDDLPIPNEKLEKFQFEVREVMKSGCNLQIAEYSLLEYNIESNLNPYIDKYNEIKKKFMDLVKGDVEVYLRNLSESKIKKDDNSFENNNTNMSVEDEDESKDNNRFFEEEADEILEKNTDKVEKIKDKSKEQIKEGLMILFGKKVENSAEKDIFISLKREYMKKREAVIESALRLVKKIVNDDKEYEKFHKKYYDKEEKKN